MSDTLRSHYLPFAGEHRVNRRDSLLRLPTAFSTEFPASELRHH